MADRDANRALTLFTKQYAEGKDLAALTDELVSLCRDLLLLKTAPKTGASMLTGVCTDAELKTKAGNHDFEGDLYPERSTDSVQGYFNVYTGTIYSNFPYIDEEDG